MASRRLFRPALVTSTRLARVSVLLRVLERSFLVSRTRMVCETCIGWMPPDRARSICVTAWPERPNQATHSLRRVRTLPDADAALETVDSRLQGKSLIEHALTFEIEVNTGNGHRVREADFWPADISEFQSA